MSQHAQTETDVECEQSSPDSGTEPALKDGGSVPDKQIARWKNEGGSWFPED